MSQGQDDHRARRFGVQRRGFANRSANFESSPTSAYHCTAGIVAVPTGRLVCHGRRILRTFGNYGNETVGQALGIAATKNTSARTTTASKMTTGTRRRFSIEISVCIHYHTTPKSTIASFLRSGFQRSCLATTLEHRQAGLECHALFAFPQHCVTGFETRSILASRGLLKVSK